MPWRHNYMPDDGKPNDDNGNDNKPNPTPPKPAANNTEGEEWLRKELADVRKEAGDRRIEARTANEALEGARTELASMTDAKGKADTRATKAETDLIKYKIAIRAGVPGERAEKFASLLQGATEDEIIEFANTLIDATGAGSTDHATDHSQGRGSQGAKPVQNTPQAEFAEMFANLPIFKN